MRTLATSLILSVTLTACSKPADPPPPQPATSGEQQAAKPPDPGLVLAAAGVELTLPSTWTILDDPDPDFALARGPGDSRATCTIELRRQGTAAAPKDARVREHDLDFTRGILRARTRSLPGPSESSTIVISCLAPNAAQWSAIEAAFDSQTASPPSSPTRPVTQTGPIVQLCTGTPAYLTYVCVRRDDGAVYCGASEGEALTRITGIEPAVQIACDGARACSRSASGSLQCWKADEGAKTIAELAEVRDIAGGCVVDARRKLACRQRESNGATTDTFAELVPFGDPAFALSEVEHVLAGSNASQGCVLTTEGLRCWDQAGKLHLPLPDNHQPHTLVTPAGATDLALLGGRVCVAADERWTCLEGERRFELDGCDRRPCGCSLLGAMQLSCDHEPFEYGVALLGRISNVVAVDGACAAQQDGTVVCRGPLAGQREDSARLQELVAGGRSGVLHVLEIRENE
jgi:hypothetical protein